MPDDDKPDPNDTPPPNDGDSEELSKWKSLSRKHEASAKAADKRVTALEGELDKLKAAQGDQEQAKHKAHQDIALAKLNARLARRGVSEETATGLLAVIDPARLLKDGAADDDAIKSVADAIAASQPKNHPVPPDQDQGKGDQGETKPKLNDLFRAAAGRRG